MAMAITGGVVRNARKKSGLSQNELAKGICTQATISSIENGTANPQYEIIFAICKRLKLKLSDVNNGERYSKSVFATIENDMRKHCYQDAHCRFDKINFDKMKTDDQRGKYFCYKGFLQLFINEDVHEASYCFNMVTSQYKTDTDQGKIYFAWSQLGLALANKEMGQSVRAQFFLKQASEQLHIIWDEATESIETITDISLDVVVVFIELRDYMGAKKLIELTRRKLVANNSLYGLEFLEELDSKCLYATGESFEATKKQFSALLLAEIKGNSELFEKITTNNQQPIIDLVRKASTRFEGKQVFIK